MNAKQWYERMKTEFENDPEYHYAYLRLQVIEDFLEVMDRTQISRAELARRLGCSNAYITKLLRGSQNLTLQKLVEIAFALNMELKVSFVRRTIGTIREKAANTAKKLTPVGKPVNVKQTGKVVGIVITDCPLCSNTISFDIQTAKFCPYCNAEVSVEMDRVEVQLSAKRTGRKFIRAQREEVA